MLLLTSFAAVATAIAYADASVARVGLLTHRVLLQLPATNALSLLRVPGDTATLTLLLLTIFAAVSTAIAYDDGSVGRFALLTVFKVTCCSYRICYDANCYYERVIAISRTMKHCYVETATANEFCNNCYRDRLR